jgi:hypothetical protein
MVSRREGIQMDMVIVQSGQQCSPSAVNNVLVPPTHECRPDSGNAPTRAAHIDCSRAACNMHVGD